MENEEYYANLSGKISTIDGDNEKSRAEELHGYIINEDIESIKKFIADGKYDENYYYYNNYSPLHDALDTKNYKIFEIIIEKNADRLYIEKKRGKQTIIDRILELNDDKLFRYVINKMSIYTSKFGDFSEKTEEWEKEVLDNEMLFMIKYGTFDHAVEAIKKSSGVNWKDSLGGCVLQHAVSYGKENIVKYLIRHGADVNSVNNYGSPVLRGAILKYPIFKILVDNGASLDIKDKDGESVGKLIANVKKFRENNGRENYKQLFPEDPNGDNWSIYLGLADVLDENIYAYAQDDFFDEDVVSSRQTRKAIPSQIKIEVWRRDEGRCVECSSQENLEYDHIIPVSKGGANTARNIQLLCQNCNRLKYNNIM